MSGDKLAISGRFLFVFGVLGLLLTGLAGCETLGRSGQNSLQHPAQQEDTSAELPDQEKESQRIFRPNTDKRGRLSRRFQKLLGRDLTVRVDHGNEDILNELADSWEMDEGDGWKQCRFTLSLGHEKRVLLAPGCEGVAMRATHWAVLASELQLLDDRHVVLARLRRGGDAAVWEGTSIHDGADLKMSRFRRTQ